MKIKDRIDKAKERGALGQFHIFGTRPGRSYDYVENVHTRKAADAALTRYPDAGLFSNQGCLLEGYPAPPPWIAG